MRNVSGRGVKRSTGQKWASQCKSCKSIESVKPDGRSHWIPSIVDLPSLQHRECPSCNLKNKNEKTVI